MNSSRQSELSDAPGLLVCPAAHEEQASSEPPGLKEPMLHSTHRGPEGLELCPQPGAQTAHSPGSLAIMFAVVEPGGQLVHPDTADCPPAEYVPSWQTCA